jgi:hypothetical protein
MTSATLAQDVAPVFCADLGEVDCTLLEDSSAAMLDLSSAGFSFALDMSMNMPAPTRGQPDSLSFSMEGSGAYALDRGMFPGAIFTPQDMTENLEQLPELFEQTLKAIEADANLTLFFSRELAALTGTPLPDKAGLSFRMVDGVAYINLDKMAELDTTGSVPRGWLGFEVAEFMRQTLDQQMGSLGSSLNMSPLSGFNNQELTNQFVTITRLADVDVSGQTAAVFESRYDMSAMMDAPEMQDAIRDALQESFSNSEMTKQQVDQMVDQMMPMMTELYDGFEMTTTQVIGLHDKFVHQGTLTLAWPFDMGSLSGMRGQSLDLSFNLEYRLDRFNDAAQIEAPPNAMMIPLSGLMSGSPQA